jgi:hypothetical protein
LPTTLAKRVYFFQLKLGLLQLSEGEIESITVLKAKEAIEKYGLNGVHGAIKIKGKKNDRRYTIIRNI